MATTGADLYSYLQQKWDHAYSTYFGPTQTNRLIRETIFRTIKKKEGFLATQKIYDELSVLIKSNQVYSLNNNRIYTAPLIISNITYSGAVSNATITVTTLFPHNLVAGSLGSVTIGGVSGLTLAPITAVTGTFAVVTAPTANTFTFVATNTSAITGTYTANSGYVTYTNMITDYDHFLTARAKFKKPLTPVISGVSSAADMVVTAVKHNLRALDKIEISGVVGTEPLQTNINASHTVLTVPTKNTFSVAASGVGGVYTSGGAINLVYYEYVTVLTSNEKIAIYSQATELYPKVEFYQKLLRFYGDRFGDLACPEITIDYVALPAVEIDTLNTTLDLEKYWTAEFLYYLCDAIVKNFAVQSRDGELFQMSSLEIIDNQ